MRKIYLAYPIPNYPLNELALNRTSGDAQPWLGRKLHWGKGSSTRLVGSSRPKESASVYLEAASLRAACRGHERLGTWLHDAGCWALRTQRRRTEIAQRPRRAYDGSSLRKVRDGIFLNAPWPQPTNTQTDECFKGFILHFLPATKRPIVIVAPNGTTRRAALFLLPSPSAEGGSGSERVVNRAGCYSSDGVNCCCCCCMEWVDRKLL